MQKIHKLCLFFVLFNLVGCSSSWPDDLKGTKNKLSFAGKIL